ncbi:LacI family transcriptional regulator [Peptoniphilus sp. KCTC 25270]|uniref:LacI family DNA-binding transcriptional regulator n=1 Tax=Peptoniphilus sp. KCTC 25270 TaxID=2897414 RepID=UPI001E3A0A1B|nr:LacI family DNA-binding transcriptional regulator [Peptoniphilus sp. KCTC 25270]MCD1146705.1 LacI family transcriptional regulator [Peptoniphilus sp. KCTC 25270]
MASTIKDVAKMADVSISTVSRVINDSKPVSPEARRRVMHAIEVLDYKPNEVARSLVTKKSNLIGVIVSDIGNSYVSQVLRGVEEIGRMYQYDILLSSSYGDPEVEVKFAKLFSRKQVEGIIIISEILNQKLLYKLDEFKIPCVVINRFYNIEEAPTVTINNKAAAYNMTDYLTEMGHKDIGYVVLRNDMDRTNEKYKIKGYRDAMEANGLTPKFLYAEGTDEEAAKDIFRQHEEEIRNKKYSVLFCSQDLLAINLMNVMRDNGMTVPDDMSFAGFGGSSLSEIYRPKLTTVKEPYYDIGAVAIRKLLKNIDNKKVDNDDEMILLPVEIIKRQSVMDLNKEK